MLKTNIPNYFKERRDRLAQQNPGAAFILPAHPDYPRNWDVTHPYRQDSNLYYLSGFDEPNSVLVMVPGSDPKTYKTIFFVQERVPSQELWTGEIYGPERAVKVFGADEAYPISELSARLSTLLKHAERVFYRLGNYEANDRLILEQIEKHRESYGRSGKGLLPVCDPIPAIGEHRLFKSAEELENLRRASKASIAAHREMMKAARPGVNERELEGLLHYQFLKNGCTRPGYGTIVAGGFESTCLHYTRNDQALKKGDLLLVDAGGEYDYYTADITRTIPVGEEMSPAQAKVYDVVLHAQIEVIKMVKPGIKFGDLHARCCEILTEGLISLGALQGDLKSNIESRSYVSYFPHGTSHWLGMDVHDAGFYFQPGSNDQLRNRPLEPGMVFTVEPGLYFQPTDKGYPEQFRGIGIRIEDNIVVTKNGHENLTEGLEKTRDEIRSLRS